MDLELSGKRALITGASRGIGKAIAAVLHANGCRVALNARGDADLGAAVVGLSGAVSVAGDVSQLDQARSVVAQAVSALGGLDILVCNAGSGRSVPPGEETAEEWQRMFAVNLWSATRTVEAARPALQSARGVIVCISSICGSEVVPGAPVAYSAAKAALNSFVRTSARPLAKLGIRINAVAPGNILHESSTWSRRMTADAAGVQAMLDRDVALARLGQPVEVADLVAFLASARSGFATGTIITLDGGQSRS